MTDEQLLELASRIQTQHPFVGKKAHGVVQALKRCKITREASGTELCREGEAGDELFVLLAGTVEVSKRDPSGKQRPLTTLGPPALFGHMALVDRSPRSASCKVSSEAWLARMDRLTFERLLKEPSPIGSTWRRLLLSSLSNQLHRGNDRLRGIMMPTPPASADMKQSQGKSAKKRRKKPAGDVAESDLLAMAGVLEGWQVDTQGVDNIKSIEDEDMKRTREARALDRRR